MKVRDDSRLKPMMLAPVELVHEDGVVEQVSSGLNARGQELPDGVPFAPVVKNPPPTLADTIRRMFRDAAFKHAMDMEGLDTPEEADDFDIADDPLDPLTPYEAHFFPPPEPPPPSNSKAMQEVSKGQEPSVPPADGSTSNPLPETPKSE